MKTTLDTGPKFSVLSEAGDVASGGDDEDASIEYVGVAGYHHVITGFAWSYTGADPVGGHVEIYDEEDTVFQMSITSKGAGIIIFPFPKKFTAGQDIGITLEAGGAGVSCDLSILNHYLEKA
jgi:hypothetical protein